jgi:hypothetical protein
MTFKQWIVDLFEDERGSTSIKPVIAFMGALFLCITMTINAFSHHDFAPSDNLVDAVLIITAIGMGSDTVDKFSFKRGKPKPDPEQINEEPN